MKSTHLISASSLLAAAAAASIVWWQVEAASVTADSLAVDGIGPLRLGQEFGQAERQAFRLAPDTAFSGPGCSGLDEIRYETELGGHPASIMAMADGGRINEVEATLLQPVRADSRAACLDLRDDFAAVFFERFGDYSTHWEVRKPVSEELLARTGPVVLKARWFSAGNSCYVSAHFQQAERADLLN